MLRRTATNNVKFVNNPYLYKQLTRVSCFFYFINFFFVFFSLFFLFIKNISLSLHNIYYNKIVITMFYIKQKLTFF